MAKPIKLMSTAYGPPWGGIQGTGVTKTGVDLHKHPKQYVVAVDPNVIPLGTKLRIKHNPFGDPNIVFTAADTGGAIKGNRLDFYDWRGRKTQMSWGTRPIEAEILGHGNPAKPQRAGAGGSRGAAGGTGATFLPGTPSSGFESGGGGDLAAILGAMMTPPAARVASVGLPDPSFSARRSLALPHGYQGVQSSGGPPPPSDLGDVIRGLLPALGGDIPKASKPGLLIPGAAGTSADAPAGKPLGKTVVGSPVPGMKPLRATHETLGLPGYPAADYLAPAGTPVVAPVSGKIIRFSGNDPKKGAVGGAGGPLGWSIYLKGDDGKTYFLTHLGTRNEKLLGKRVRAGAQIGTIADYNSYGRPDHVHVGVHG